MLQFDGNVMRILYMIYSVTVTFEHGLCMRIYIFHLRENYYWITYILYLSTSSCFKSPDAGDVMNENVWLGPVYKY